MRHDSLGRVAGDLISYVQLFRDAPDTSRPAAEQLKRRIAELLEAVSTHPAAARLDPSELEAARFALVAWIDETVLSSTWSGRDHWSAELLQMQYFRTNKGGDEFYQRLQALPPDANNAREVFFLCLCAGFEGAMYDQPSERQALTAQLYETLRVAGFTRDAVGEQHLSPSAYDLAIEVTAGSSRTLTPTILAWVLGTTLAFGLFVGALWLLAGTVDVAPDY